MKLMMSRSLFQFPHTRETCLYFQSFASPLFSIPAHAGNIRQSYTTNASNGFNSRTRGKHPFLVAEHSAKSFNSRTRGKHLSVNEYTNLVRFNSRTRGKHLVRPPLDLLFPFQFPHTRETFEPVHVESVPYVSIPAHAGNIATDRNACRRIWFQFPHTRETSEWTPRASWTGSFNSRTRGKHRENILKTGNIWYNALFTFINNCVFYLIFKQ